MLTDAAMSLAGNVAALMHTTAPDEVLKNSFANFAFEHYEIAAYRSLLVLSDMYGHGAAASVLQKSLEEELAMAKWIDEHLAATTRIFASRSEAGLTAGV